MTEKVCLDRNMRITGTNPTVLGAERWSATRLVANTTVASVVDGAITKNTELPGKLMLSLTATWTSDSPLEAMMVVRITRGPRRFISSAPNVIEFRDLYTVGYDETPQVPDVSRSFTSAESAGIDRGTNETGLPTFGRIHLRRDMTCVDYLQDQPLRPGGVFNVSYRCYAWTPAPWSDNASANSPIHEAYANFVRIQLIALPTQDPAIR